MKYKVQSQNTTKFIDLHDCDCSCFRYDGADITLGMEWMEILAEHPDNPFEKAHQSGEGMIKFEAPIILGGKISKQDGTTEIINADVFAFYDTELTYYFENDTISTKYKYAQIDAFGSGGRDFITIEFLFKKSVIMWNELNEESWFEGRKRKSPITNEDIIKMLSCNNSEEEQKRGMELASKNKYIGCFFQPCMDRGDKSAWENCASVLSNKSDEELTPWLLKCFEWLQDMNWPGAERIAERLSRFKNSEVLNSEKEKAIRIAELSDDDEWLEWLRRVK